MSDPTYEQIMQAIGERIWDDAPHLREGHHRDLVFSTTWQDVMWSVQQGVHDAYGLRGISECDDCYRLQDACPAHKDSPLLLENVERNRRAGE